MCEVCLMKAETNKLNAAALLDLANAASVLACNVPGSGTTVTNIVDRIEKMAEMPREEKVSGEAGTAPQAEQPAKDAKLPREMQALKTMLASMGIHAEFIDLDAEKKLH